jgi:hypothetical protein
MRYHSGSVRANTPLPEDPLEKERQALIHRRFHVFYVVTVWLAQVLAVCAVLHVIRAPLWVWILVSVTARPLYMVNKDDVIERYNRPGDCFGVAGLSAPNAVAASSSTTPPQPNPMAGVPELWEKLDYKPDPSKVGVVIARLRDPMVNINARKFDPLTAMRIQKEVEETDAIYKDDPNVMRRIVEEWYIWIRLEPRSNNQ